MAYADEPNVVRGKSGAKKFIFLGLGVFVFLLVIFSAAFWPWYHDFRRHHTPTGTHGGSVHMISIENNRFSMELARPEPIHSLVVFLDPVQEDLEWNPGEFRMSFQVAGMPEPEFLDWNEEGMLLADLEQLAEYDPLSPTAPPIPRIAEFYGPSDSFFHPSGDSRMDLTIYRGDEVVWRGSRWSYGTAGHHHH